MSTTRRRRGTPPRPRSRLAITAPERTPERPGPGPIPTTVLRSLDLAVLRRVEKRVPRFSKIVSSRAALGAAKKRAPVVSAMSRSVTLSGGTGTDCPPRFSVPDCVPSAIV